MDKNNLSKTVRNQTLPCWTLSMRQRCDLELLLNGGFAPLSGYMDQKAYDSVLDTLHLPDGSLWPIPIVLDVSKSFAEKLKLQDQILLRDDYGFIIAKLTIQSIWNADKQREAMAVYGCDDREHPSIAALYNEIQDVYLGGELTEIEAPQHFSFLQWRHTPEELKHEFSKRGWQKIVAFQTRNPMHKAHYELTRYAIKKANANLLIHPVVGVTAAHDIDYFRRVHCYSAILKYYPEQSSMLSLLPLAMRMAGPREALWHALIRRNYGCTHFIVGRDHASPITRSNKQYYAPYAAEALVRKYQDEAGIDFIFAKEIVYSPDRNIYLPIDKVKTREKTVKLSGAQFRHLLEEGQDVPKWYSFPEVVSELKEVYPVKYKQGLVILITGLPAAGKTSLARALADMLHEVDYREITLLDGDEVRNILSSGLGFTADDRKQHLKRVTYIAKEVSKHKGIAICSVIAPFHEARKEMREQIGRQANFFEIYLSTPLEICKERDFKGLYQKALTGHIKDVTGLDSPYEKPSQANLTLNMAELGIKDAISKIVLKLQEQELLKVYP